MSKLCDARTSMPGCTSACVGRAPAITATTPARSLREIIVKILPRRYEQCASGSNGAAFVRGARASRVLVSASRRNELLCGGHRRPDARAPRRLISRCQHAYDFHMAHGQLLLTGVPGPELDSESAKIFRRIQPGG